jgi:hypothetical protein
LFGKELLKALKPLALALCNANKGLTQSGREWKTALNELAIIFTRFGHMFGDQ